MDKSVYLDLIKIQDTHWWYVGRKKLLMNVLVKYINKENRNRNILDLGCGTGAMLKVAKQYGNVYGMDYNSSAVAYCNDILHENVKQGSLPNKVPYKNNMFDVIMCLDVLEHVKEDVESLETIFNLLKNNGIAIITVPAFQFLWGYNDDLVHHFRRYTKDDLISKSKNVGFSIINYSYFNVFLFPGIYLVRKLKKILNIQKPDLEETPKDNIINKLLRIIFLFEIKLQKYIRFPFGVSIFIILKK